MEEKTEDKQESKHGLSKETLERILETKAPRKEIKPIKESDSIISDEEIKLLSKLKEIEKKNSEEKTTRNVPKPIFLERELSEEFSPNTKKEKNENISSEYITRNKMDNSETKQKYQSYEHSPSRKFESPENISKSWSDPIGRREVEFIHSEQDKIGKQEQRYEIYTNPKKFDEKDFSRDKKSNDFKVREVKMQYYNDNH